jgi:hypothetical protein
VVGLGSGAGAVFAFDLGPLAAARPAHADEFDVIIDPIINSSGDSRRCRRPNPTAM